MENNTLSIISNSYALNDFGYKSSKLDKDEKGHVLIKLTEKDENGDNMLRPVRATAEQESTLEKIAVVQDFNSVAKIVLCNAIAGLEDFATNNGFKTIGEFCETNFGLSAVTANQYKRVGDYFITERDGKVVWKYSWLNGVSVSNLVQCLALVKKAGGVDDFYEQYIDVENGLPIYGTLSALKKAIANLAGNKKDGKKEGKKDGKQEGAGEKEVAGVESIGSKWYSICEYLAEKTDMNKALKKAIDTISAYIEQEQEQ